MLPDVGLANFVEGANQLKGLALGGNILANCFLTSPALPRFPCFNCALKEEGHWHIQNTRKLVQLAGARPVGSFLVLLNLLKCQADSLAKCGLAHTEQCAALPDTVADENIDWMRSQSTTSKSIK